MAFNFLGAGGGALSGAAAGSMFGPVGTIGGAVLGGLGGSNLFGAKSTTGQGLPSYNPKQALKLQQQQYNQMANNALGFQSRAYDQIFPQGLQGAQSIFNQESGQALGYGGNLYNQAANQGFDFAQRGTAANIANQEAVTPGSYGQRQAALDQINAYIQGQVPLDVQQNTQRAIAQSFGGGYNPFTGGGQAPSAFARNIGQTSVGLSQFGLSAAPTWQQLSKSFVVGPEVGLQAGLQAAGQGASLAQGSTGQAFGLSQNLLGSGTGLVGAASQLGNDMSQSVYNSGFNQYQGNQLQNQQNQQLGLQLGQMGIQGYDAYNKAQYLNSLNPSMQGKLATLGGLPSASAASSYMSSLGYNPSAMHSILK
jgi:hypothetical protein